MYQVRFRLPTDLAAVLGMAEFRRSLHTSDYRTARSLCLAATAWFNAEMQRLRGMATPTREDLEEAARSYFAEQAEIQGRTTTFDKDRLDEQAGYHIDLAQQGVRQMDDDLISGEFSGPAHSAALQLVRSLDAEFDELPEDQRLSALRLGARVVRELSVLMIHRLSDPAGGYSPHDPIFASQVAPPPGMPLKRAQRRIAIGDAATQFMDYQKARNLSASTLTEAARVLRWLGERFGNTTDLAALSTDDLKAFRSDLTRVDKRLQGREQPFDRRLTGNADAQIQYATYIKYWRSLQQFFRWATEERLIASDPSGIAAPPKPKGLRAHSPEPFTSDELRRLFQTPLYAGHKSPKQVSVPGTCVSRGGHWWAAVMLAHTGMRAGELSQLTTGDFHFDDEIPFVRVHDEGEVDGRKRALKNRASVRSVPLHPNLLRLGLREFVDRIATRQRNGRVFEVYRLGNGRASAGITRFWGDYFVKFGLKKEGRATHVWRHTVIARLKGSQAPLEDIAAVVGHGKDLPPIYRQTMAYGGDLPLRRTYKTILELDYGFDLVEALGGPYSPERHR